MKSTTNPARAARSAFRPPVVDLETWRAARWTRPGVTPELTLGRQGGH
ncbi:hypothetical protein AB0J83_39335 [Actinoplanes sp. NPDC049596]